jgi:hypothetical protein
MEAARLGRSYPVEMADAPVLGSPIEISTHPDGRFSIDFDWASPPDALWLKAVADLLRRSGRDSLVASTERLTLFLDPQDAEAALDDLAALLEDANHHYRNDVERRDAALRYVQDSLRNRYDVTTDVPVREL